MEIGNRKKRLRFYTSFPGRQPNVPRYELIKSSQEAKRHLTELPV